MSIRDREVGEVDGLETKKDKGMGFVMLREET